MGHRKPHKLQQGLRIHNWFLIKKYPYRAKAATLKRHVWKARCRCGKEEDVPEYYLLREPNPKKDCGCSRKSIITLNPWEYRVWVMMHVRCYNPQHIAYKHYGGRGIHVCPEWHKENPDGKGFERFLEFMGKRPSLKFSIDRVDNDGSYYPFQEDGKTRQCRWATAEQQRANQRQPGAKTMKG